jgi:hypothetical protein
MPEKKLNNKNNNKKAIRRKPMESTIDVLIETPQNTALIKGDRRSQYRMLYDHENVAYIQLPKESLDCPPQTAIGTIVKATDKWSRGRECLITLRQNQERYVREQGTNSQSRIYVRVFDALPTGRTRERVADVTKSTFCRNYVNAMTKRIRTEWQQFSNKHETARHDEIQARRALRKALGEMQVLNELAERYRVVFSDGDKGAKKKFADEYQKLLDNPKIRGIMLEDNILTIHTGMIYCVDPRDRIEREIGEMKIDVDLEDSDVTIFNTTRKVNTPAQTAANAPHVNSSGTPCFGNISETVTELIAKYEIVMLIEVLFSFLESVNIHDTNGGALVHYWPQSARSKKAKKRKASK